MKALIQSIVLAIVLFLYGYLLSTVGHDHSQHQPDGHSMNVNQEDHTH